MARGFGATLGNSTSDIITTTFTTAAPSKRSYSSWHWLRSGATGFPRFWQKDATTTNIECLYCDQSAGAFTLQFGWSGSAGGVAAWQFGTTSQTNLWNHILVTYDDSSSSNVPVAYVDGIFQSINVVTAPSGSPAPTSDALTIGNRAADSGRCWDGYLAEIAFWDGVLLTASEALALFQGANPTQIRRTALSFYEPLYGLGSPEPDLSGGAKNGTVTGTVKRPGPPIAMSTPRWPQDLTPPPPPVLPYMVFPLTVNVKVTVG